MIIDLVKDYGADPTGNTEIGGVSGPLQAAINAVQSGNGGKIILRDGTFLLNGGVTISSGGVIIEGQGWESYSGYQAQNNPPIIGTHGTYIKTTTTANDPFLLLQTVNHAEIKKIAFTQTQPTDTPGWTPTVYGPTIALVSTAAQVGGTILLEDLFCWNVYNFIQLGVNNLNAFVGAGGIWLNRICGTPLKYGILVYSVDDVLHVNGVHFWPYGNNANIPGTGVANWISKNGIAIQLFRCDDPVFNDIFAYGYNVGLALDVGVNGTPQGITGSNILFDSCNIGVAQYLQGGTWPGGVPVTNRFTNFGVQSAVPSTLAGGGYGIWLSGGNSIFFFANNYIGNSANSAVVAAVSGVQITCSNTHVNFWNQNNAGGNVAFDAVVSGSEITITGSLRTDGGNGASVTGGLGTINNSHVN